MYCKVEWKGHQYKTFLLLDKLTFNVHVNVLGRSCKVIYILIIRYIY